MADHKTRSREIAGLTEACKRLRCSHGFIITLAAEEEVNERGISIKIVPAYRFWITCL